MNVSEANTAAEISLHGPGDCSCPTCEHPDMSDLWLRYIETQKERWDFSLCYFTMQDAPKISSQLSSALLLWLRVWWKGHSSHHREQFSPFQHLQEQTQVLGECRRFRLWCWSPIQDAQGCRKCGDRRWSPLFMVGPDSGVRYSPGLWRPLNTDYN